MKCIRTFSPLLIAAGLMVFSASVSAEVAVITNSSSQIAGASNDEVKRLFLGKSRTIGGNSATPIDQNKTSSVREHFYDVVVGKSSSQLRAYWSKLIFTGKGKPPKELGSDADVVAAVAADPELIGYVDANAVTGSVVVILIIQ